MNTQKELYGMTKASIIREYREAKKIFRQSLKNGPESSASKLGSTKIINDWVSDPTYKTFWSYIKNNQKKKNFSKLKNIF